MNFCSVQEMAKKWGISERSIRNQCAAGRVDGAVLMGRTWKIPADAEKPQCCRKGERCRTPLLERLQQEQAARQTRGMYQYLQIELTYHSNRIEGSGLTQGQVRSIYETNSIGITEEPVVVDDVIEAVNHFQCIDRIIQRASEPLTEEFILELHKILKTGTSDSRLDWFAVGAYKKVSNEVGGRDTTPPQEAPGAMEQLLIEYHSNREKQLEDLIDFHVRFEHIHPFQDGNGRVGRLILFKECLRYGVVPFVIQDDLKMFYYRGLSQWGRENGYLLDTCLAAQDRFKKYLQYFGIPF